MNFTTGQQIILGENRYEITRLLGSGAVSDAYLAVPLVLPGNEVVIKVVRSDLDLGDPETLQALEGLRNEARVLRVLNQAEIKDWQFCLDVPSRLEKAISTRSQRRIVALLDSGETDTQQPYQVQEKAPPAIENVGVETIEDEWRILEIMASVLEVLILAHKNGMSLKDFEPNTKWDRIRVAWLDEVRANFDLKIIDWNITGGAEGVPQDLLYYGGHLFRLLFNHNISFEGKEHNLPPVNLGALTRNWTKVTEGSRQILQRILQRDIKKRYQVADDLRVEFGWWMDTLQESRSPDGFSSLQNRLWELKRQDKFTQVLSVADLALRVFTADDAERIFSPWVEQARQELEKREVLPIARARGTLMTGSFDKAALEFERELNSLAPESEAARQANIYIALARTGDQLKKALNGIDIRPLPEWLALERGVDQLIKRHPDMALLSFNEAVQIQAELSGWSWFQQLNNRASASLKYSKVSEELSETDQGDAGARSDKWLAVEQGQLEHIKRLIEQLREAQELDSRNLEIRSRYQDEQARLKQREEILRSHQTIQQYLDQGESAWQQACQLLSPDQVAEYVVLGDLQKFEGFARQALEVYQGAWKESEILFDLDPGHLRTQYQREKIRKQLELIGTAHANGSRRIALLAALNELRPKVREWMERGFYSQARDELSLSRQRIASQVPELQILEVEANFGSGIENQASGNWETLVQDTLPNLRIRDVEILLQEILGAANKPFLSFPNGSALPQASGNRTFVLNEVIRKKAADLARALPRLKTIEESLRDIESKPDTDIELVRLLSEAREFLSGIDPNYDLSNPLKERLEETRLRTEKSSQLSAEINQRPGFARLQEIAFELSKDGSQASQQMREQAGARWIEQVYTLIDLSEIKDMVSTGIKLFQGLEAARILSKHREQVDNLELIEQSLQVEAGRAYPAWLADENDLRLARFVDILNSLGNETWPVLRQKASGLKTKLSQLYESWVMEYIEALQARYAQPAEPLEGILDDLQRQKRVDILLSENARVGITLFEQSLQQSIQLKRAFQQAESEFSSNTSPSFTTTYNKIRDEVSMDGMSGPRYEQNKKVLEEWKQASLMELARNKQPDNNEPYPYSSLVAEFTAFLGIPFVELSARPAVRYRLEDLRRELRGKRTAILGELSNEFKQEAVNILAQPQSSSERLVKLFWQLRWYRAQTDDESEKEHLKSILGGVSQCCQKMSGRATELWNRLENEQGLNVVRQQLDYFSQFLHGLRDLPVELQPLFTKKDDYVLPADIPQPDRADEVAAQIKELSGVNKIDVLELSQAIADLTRLDGLLRTVMSTIPVRDGSPVLQHVGMVRTTLLPLANLLPAIAAQVVSLGALHSLLELENLGAGLRQAAQNPASLWLLGNYQQYLQGKYDELLASCKGSLQSQAQGYLRGDLVSAADKLWTTMIQPCDGSEVSPDTLAMVRDAIVKAGEIESGIVVTSKGKRVADKGRAKRIWQAINLASARGQSPEWKALSKVATEQEKSLSGLDPRWRFAFAFVGLLGLFVIGAVIYWQISVVQTNNKDTIATRMAIASIEVKKQEDDKLTKVAETITAIAKDVNDALTQAAQRQATLTSAAQTETARLELELQNNLTLTGVAIQNKCKVSENYGLVVSNPQAILHPEPVYPHSDIPPEPEYSAMWELKNNKECPWPVLDLYVQNSDKSYQFLQLDWNDQSYRITPPESLAEPKGLSKLDPATGAYIRLAESDAKNLLINQNQTVTLKIVFNGPGDVATDLTGHFPVEGKWSLLKGKTIIGDMTLALPKDKANWITGLRPTPTPTKKPIIPTYTKTPRPTEDKPTPIPPTKVRSTPTKPPTPPPPPPTPGG